MTDHEMAFVEGSDNVFADLELDNADELLLRAQLGYSVRQLLLDRELSHGEIGDLLSLENSDVLSLMDGKYHLFSEGRLCGFLHRLNQKVVIQISQHQEGEPLQQVALANV